MRKPFLRRPAFTLIELLVVIAIIAVLVALLVPAVQKARYMAARTQSTNNLKQCALGSHAYHDVWKCLPFNGVTNATSTDYTSGSWAYQILPYIDQQPLYDSQPGNTSMSDPVPVLLCAIRGRPGYFTDSATASVTVTTSVTPISASLDVANLATGPAVYTNYTANPSVALTFGPQPEMVTIWANGPVTITGNEWILGTPYPPNAPSTWSNGPGNIVFGFTNSMFYGTVLITSAAVASGGAGPATDFGMNVFLNDPNGGIGSLNVNRQLSTISNGASNTILVGHAYVQTSVYPSTTAVPSALQSIFIAGSLATGRNSLGNTAANWLQDGTATTANQWGSPMYEGGLMAMCDGTVRTFPYATPLTNFLLPDDGNPVELP